MNLMLFSFGMGVTHCGAVKHYRRNLQSAVDVISFQQSLKSIVLFQYGIFHKLTTNRYFRQNMRE